MTGRSPLHNANARLGARFVDFGGWEMPLQYGSVLGEHRTVRQSVGVFDVSHLGRLSVLGPGAISALKIFTNDAAGLEPGRTHYTMLLDEAGGIIDDIVVWRWQEDDYWVLPNAANSDTVRGAIEATGPDVTVADLRPTTALMAVQGPDAPQLLEEVFGSAPGRFRTAEAGSVRLAGTGYTGEKGGEVCVAAGEADGVFENLLAAGAVACGLGARDTLRLEAGLLLWGSDIDRSTTPLEAGLEFAVDWEHDFTGKPALEAQRDRGVERRLSGLVLQDRGVPRHGYSVRSGDSTGTVTSGNISPMLDRGIALAYMTPPVEVGAEGAVEIRGKWVRAVFEDPPFYR